MCVIKKGTDRWRVSGGVGWECSQGVLAGGVGRGCLQGVLAGSVHRGCWQGVLARKARCSLFRYFAVQSYSLLLLHAVIKAMFLPQPVIHTILFGFLVYFLDQRDVSGSAQCSCMSKP